MKTLAVVITGLLMALQLHAQSPSLDSLNKILIKNPPSQDTSRAKLLNEISNQWSRINGDSALFFAHLAYAISAKQDFKPGMAESLSTLGWININMGKFGEGYQNYMDALEYFTDIKDDKGRAGVYNGLGVTYGMQENYSEALQYFLKALTIFEKYHATTGMASCYIKIGTVYQKIHEYDKSLQNFTKAVQLAKTTNDKANESFAYNNIATIYGITHQFQKCLEATITSKQLAEEAKSEPALATSYMNMGMAYTELKQYILSDSSLRKALHYFKRLKKEEQISRTYNGLANLYLAQQQYSKAKAFIDSSNAIAQKLNSKPLIYDNYETLANISKGEGNLETATQIYATMLALKDTLYDAEKNHDIERLKAAYDLEKKQNTIEELKKENVSKTKQRNYLVMAVVAGILFVLLLAFSFIELKRKNNLLLTSKKELKDLNDLKDRFFSILSHDLRSPIGNILLVIDFLNSGMNITEQERYDLLKKLKSATSSTLETMDNMLEWGKLQSQTICNAPKKISVQETVNRVCRFLEHTAANKSITIVNKIDEPFVVNADENQFEFILRNLISNALKFSYTNSKVEIWARNLNSFVCIYVRDFGTGMTQQLQENLFSDISRASITGTAGEKGSGLGLVLCNEFIAKNNGTLTVKSEEGIGTTFAIKLPVTES